MTTYFRKPIFVEAFRWTGDADQSDDPAWIVEAIKAGKVRFEDVGMPGVHLLADNLDGTMAALPGDWILIDEHGEIRTVPVAKFLGLYGPVIGDKHKFAEGISQWMEVWKYHQEHPLTDEPFASDADLPDPNQPGGWLSHVMNR